MFGLRRACGLAFISVLLLINALSALPASADEAPQWETIADTGALGDDVARFTGASPTLNMVNQGLDTVFVTGTSGKPQAVSNTGINDLDVGTTAYNADTGAVRWRTTYDRGVGIHDQIGAFEVNFHNNLIYEIVNSGSDIVTIERGVSDGKISRSAISPGATARDSAISSTGGFLGVVGSRGSNLLAMTYQTGSQTVELDATPVAGRAHSADISHTGTLDTTRTLLVTGQSSGFGTGGDMYTTAYNYRTGAQLWERSFASPNNKADEGLVAEAGHVSALNTGVGFVAGRTFTPESGWNILLSAYDLATGNPVWASPVTFDGSASDDDSPTHLAYSNSTSTLYLTGTSERGTPHGQDVVTIAYDAATGQQQRIAYAAGDSANADDAPTGLGLSKDGRRVFVAADVQNLLGTGGRQAALFAYDSALRPAGARIVGGPGDDRSAGLALNVAQSRVFLGGSSRTNTGFDHRASSFSLEGFALSKIPTQISLTEDSDTQGQFSDTATLTALLTDDSGAPLEGRAITLGLAGHQVSVVTDAGGRASATFTLNDRPGNYTATASFAPDDSFLGSDVSSDFEISREDTGMTLSSSGQGKNRTLTARLFDKDATANGFAGRQVVFSSGGTELGRATTDAGGVARLTNLPSGYRGGAHIFVASFSGDDYLLGSSASHTTKS